jgi:arylsulfatase A-like enzyme
MPRPNIVFILMDDMGWADLGCYGSTFYETPRLDALAAAGIRLTQAYAASPVCSPTRASLLTGRYPARIGITQYIGGHVTGRLCDVPYFQRLPRNERTIAAALRDGGYRTWHVGKWHLGGGDSLPTNHGFDVNIAGSDWGLPRRGYFSPYGMPNLEDGPAGEYLTDRLTDEAIRLIEAPGNGRPFFLNLWHHAVHTPIQAPTPLIEKYREKARRLGLDKLDPIESGEPFSTREHKGRNIQRRKFQSDPAYAAMIENLDTNVGRLADALKHMGQWERTLFIFTSDNGGLATAEGSPTCNAPLAEGKGWQEEGGIREPFIASWPGHIAAGSVGEEPIVSPDLYPTLLEAAQLPAEPRQHADGVSFLPALQGRPFRHDPIFWHYPHYSNQGGTPAGAVREGDWKLIEYFEDGRVEMFHLKDDVGEKNECSRAHPERAGRLRGLLAEWRTSVGAAIPARNVHWAD